MSNSQRKFAIMGENLFKILQKITGNQRLCRLLKYQDDNPFIIDDNHPNIDGTSLINDQLLIVPKVPDDDKIKSIIIVMFDKYLINPVNPDYKIVSIRFDILCPFSEWIINDGNLRPYLIMQELDSLFNDEQLSGVGNIKFSHSEPLILSSEFGGYTLYYESDEFN